jgi:acylglycerol lipase
MRARQVLAFLTTLICLQGFFSVWATPRAAAGPMSLTQLGWETSFVSWPVPEHQKPIAAIVSVHGFGLHKGAFDAFARRMNKENVAVYAMDVRGFGSWVKGDSNPNAAKRRVDFYQTIIDVETALSWVRRIHPDIPIYLLGESMGGAVALQVTALFPDSVDGLISSVPGSDYFKSTSTGMKVAMKMVRPGKPFDIGKTVIKQATGKSDLRDKWQDDPRARLDLTPKELLQFRAFMKKSLELAPKITKTPVLMFHGVKDKLAKPDGTIKLFQEIGSKDKDLVMLGNSEHLIFEQAQFDEHTIDVLSSWIYKHKKPSAAAAGVTE